MSGYVAPASCTSIWISVPSWVASIDPGMTRPEASATWRPEYVATIFPELERRSITLWSVVAETPERFDRRW